ncbi:MAG: hypothetical protein KGS48_06705 [Bacteroidetes bacterium]|nr:hypothetical protein [Bacteroidota bacterium]
MKIKYLPVLFFLSACAGSEPPLDADARLRIDTTVLAINRKVQAEIDSNCKRALQTELPRLVDSIMQLRRREIDAQLRSIPK